MLVNQMQIPTQNFSKPGANFCAPRRRKNKGEKRSAKRGSDVFQDFYKFEISASFRKKGEEKGVLLKKKPGRDTTFGVEGGRPRKEKRRCPSGRI